MTPPDDEIPPLQPVVGGVVDPADLVGRARELGQLLDAINSNGARLLGDRRIGKTSLLGKLEVELRAVGHTVIRVSAETTDPDTFSRWMVDGLRESRAIRAQWGRWEREFGGELSVKVAQVGFVLTGKTTSPAAPAASERDLVELLDEVTGRQGPHYRTIIIIDEVTVLAQALGEASERGAESFLHSLRAPRQKHHRVAMVLAGSVGLHHVVPDVSAVNDLVAVEVGPLEPDDAVYLARRLLRWENLAGQHERELAETIARLTDGQPYYIQALVEDLSNAAPSDRIDEVAISQAVDEALLHDRWLHSHYDTRIDEYFGADAAVVRQLLDIYAMADTPLPIDQVQALLQVADLESRPNRDELLDLVRKLEADHYLVRRGNADEFANELLRRAWVYRRRL